MFRNQYDTDITTWSPAGRLHQVEYAMEAVKQGSAAVGVKSKNYVVLASLKRAPHAELSSYQKKLFKIDDHMGIAIAGLAADARVLCRYMRNECMNHRFIYDSPMPVSRLVLKIADKSQVATQRSSKRPFGVGLLVSGYDDQTGTHLYQTCPSGNYYEYKAIAIGARSQSAKTYLEKYYESFAETNDLQTLILHALKALQGTTGENVELNTKNCSLSVVGKNFPYKLFEGDDIEPYLSMLDQGEEAAEEEDVDEDVHMT
jgi:20S proteasome subunit alpha 6